MFSRFAWFTKYQDRKLEWDISIHTVGFGLFLSLPMDSFQQSPGLLAAGRIMPELGWATIFFVVGIVHAYALHINGAAAWTPFVRAVAMLFNMITFMVFVVGFIYAAPYSTGLYTYLSMAFLFCGSGLVAAARDSGVEIARWRSRRRGGA